MRVGTTIALIASLAGLLPLSAAVAIWYLLAGRTVFSPHGPVWYGVAAGLATMVLVLAGAAVIGRSIERSQRRGRAEHVAPSICGPLNPEDPKAGLLARLARAFATENEDLRGPALKRFLAYAIPRAPRLIPVNINDAVWICVQAIQTGEDELSPGPQLTFDPDPNAGLVRIDPDLFHQLLLNLILNAREATGPGGHIDLRTQVLDEAILVAVRDDGPGVSNDRIESLFRPFSSSKRRALGLGLATCRQIVEQHGGFISVTNVVSRGLEIGVKLSLPTAPKIR